MKIPIDFDTPLIGGSFALPNHPEIVIEMVVDANNSPHLQFRLPLNKLLHGIDGLTEMGLPNGDSLPTTPRTLPHITAQIGGTSIHFYIGAGQVAVFVPTKFNPFITLIFPIRNKSQQILGGFGTIAKKGDHRGGFYASVELPEEFVKLIDSAL